MFKKLSSGRWSFREEVDSVTVKELVEDIMMFCFINDLPIHMTGSCLVDGINHVDIDYVIQVPSFSFACGYTPRSFYLTGTDYSGSHTNKILTFRDIHKGNVNLVFVEDEKEYAKWKAASAELKQQQLKNKEDRVRLFERIVGD